MRACLVALLLLAGCAEAPLQPDPETPRRTIRGSSVPLVGVGPADWDDAFVRLVMACQPPPRHRGIDAKTGCTALWLGGSVAAGAYAVSQRHLDGLTIAAAAIGAVAAIGVGAGVVSSLLASGDEDRFLESQRHNAVRAWAVSDAAHRLELARSVAGSCGEEDLLDQFLKKLGPPPEPAHGS